MLQNVKCSHSLFIYIKNIRSFFKINWTVKLMAQACSMITTEGVIGSLKLLFFQTYGNELGVLEQQWAGGCSHGWCSKCPEEQKKKAFDSDPQCALERSLPLKGVTIPPIFFNCVSTASYTYIHPDCPLWVSCVPQWSPAYHCSSRSISSNQNQLEVNQKSDCKLEKFV